MSIVRKRLAELEQRQVRAATSPMRLIATALQVPADADLNGTHTTSGNVVTFYNATLKQAYADRQQWLSEQSAGLIAMVSPFDSGQRVLEVLEEKHC